MFPIIQSNYTHIIVYLIIIYPKVGVKQKT